MTKIPDKSTQPTRAQHLAGRRVKKTLLAGITWFSHFKAKIDSMNVFPVPDGDTGKNMLHTLLAAAKEVKALNSNQAADIAWAAARGALMGGRGCSGMILSGFFRGFAEGVGDRASLTPSDLARAFQIGCLRARERVEDPQEGTILSVGEAAAAAALTAAPKGGLNDVLQASWEGARQALNRTPDQMQLLKVHEVVDAGGMGLVVLLEGMVRFSRGQTVNKATEEMAAVKPSKKPSRPFTITAFKYCVELILHAPDHDLSGIKAKLAPLGEELMVAQGEEGVFKIHIHAKEATLILRTAAQFGMITWKKVDDMEKQHHHQFHRE